MPKAVTQDKIDEVRAMRAQGIPVAEIEKLTGVSHNSISKYAKGVKNPAAAATTAGTEDVSYTKLTTDIITPNLGNVKPSEGKATETLTVSEDKPDVKTYGHIPETPADERKEGMAAKNVPYAVREACRIRIEYLREEIDSEMAVVRSWEQEIKELREFLGLEAND